MADKEKPWTIKPDDVRDKAGHIWFDFHGTSSCKRCGIVKPHDEQNKPCRGYTGGVSLRRTA